jgi:hypothetical protein
VDAAATAADHDYWQSAVVHLEQRIGALLNWATWSVLFQDSDH